MRIERRSIVVLGLAAIAACHAEHVTPSRRARGGGPTAPLLEGLGAHEHPVHTQSTIAQRYFDQGLALLYAFDQEMAERSFRVAASIDPQCAMCFWGIALSLDPNINIPASPSRNRAAYAAIQQARALEITAPPIERDFIEALATRHAADPNAPREPLDHAYADAMRTLAHNHPRDLDAATLFAEALMDLHPWDLWSSDGQPGPDTVEIVTTLEHVLSADPNHPGANHYYIHALEASPQPERALTAAWRVARLMPEAGHIVHMPSHIYMRLGQYADASDANVRAIEVDRRYAAHVHPTGMYLMYPAHNQQFLAHSAAMEGRFTVALQAAREIRNIVPVEMVEHMPSAVIAVPTALLTLLRFGRWNEVLAEPPPPSSLSYAVGISHYARGVALARTARVDAARDEMEALDDVRAHIAPDDMAGNNRAADLLLIAAHMLTGEIAMADRRLTEGPRQFAEAARLEDLLHYDEPPDWYPPARLRLAGALRSVGRLSEAASVYRDDLRHNPESGWSLYGLLTTLQALGPGPGRREEIADVDRRFRIAWARAEVRPEESLIDDQAPEALSERRSARPHRRDRSVGSDRLHDVAGADTPHAQ